MTWSTIGRNLTDLSRSVQFGTHCAADKYSMPPEDQLDGLGEDEYAKIVFVNREEGWVYIEHVDDADKVYGKLCDYMRSVDLHKNQRVWFVKDRIAGVHIVTMQEPTVLSSCLFLVAVISEMMPE